MDQSTAPPPRAGEWPSEFDEAVYTGHLGDIDPRSVCAASVVGHYRRLGRSEGRICSAIGARGDLIGLIEPGASILEIGPCLWPAFDKARHVVKYVDVLTTEDLRRMAAAQEGGAPAQVPEIDYVWAGGSLAELIPETFDAIYSSHNIEHQTCLISHLQDCAKLLNKGGAMFLVVPDKRYCFDHFRPESTLADILAAWMEPSDRHRALRVVQQSFFTTHNDVLRHWAGDHGDNPFEALGSREFGRAVAGLKHLYENEGYIDVHAWQFTPDSFRAAVDSLHAMELSPLGVARVYPTIYGTTEFLAILTRD